MIQSISGFFETSYNVLLFALAIWGAARFGMFVIGRSWHWAVKAVIIVAVAASIQGYLVYMTGGPKTDLCIVTEVCATAGAIYAVEWGFRQVSDLRGRAGIIAVLGIFLAVTWAENVDRFMGVAQAPSVPAATTTVRITAPSNNTAGIGLTWENLCADPDPSFTARQDLNYP